VAKKKKTKKKARKPSRSSGSASDKRTERKLQKQIYITQSLVDDIEGLRAEKEREAQEKLGDHYTLSWSQYAGSVLHEHAKKKKARAK
jgi:hypothetical protein